MGQGGKGRAVPDRLLLVRKFFEPLSFSKGLLSARDDLIKDTPPSASRLKISQRGT